MRKAWIYKSTIDIKWTSAHLAGLNWDGDWARIVDNQNGTGTITVKAGYAWDGCTPKYGILGLWVVGIPDGRLRHGKPLTYYASCVHDVFCQWPAEVPVTKAQTLAIFDEMLAHRGFVLRRIYVWFVRVFGPKRFGGDAR